MTETYTLSIPSSEEANLKCVCCGKPLKPEWEDRERKTQADQDMWDGAIVHTIDAGYGSRFDLSHFLIGICDDCIEKKVADGSMRNVGHIFPWL